MYIVDKGLTLTRNPPTPGSQVQSIKQFNSSLKQELEGGIDTIRPSEVPGIPQKQREKGVRYYCRVAEADQAPSYRLPLSAANPQDKLPLGHGGAAAGCAG